MGMPVPILVQFTLKTVKSGCHITTFSGSSIHSSMRAWMCVCVGGGDSLSLKCLLIL